jgi:hypothetical protein
MSPLARPSGPPRAADYFPTANDIKKLYRESFHDIVLDDSERARSESAWLRCPRPPSPPPPPAH